MVMRDQFQPGDRVRIKNECSGALNYGGMSTMFNEGKVIAVRDDNLDGQNIAIEWDKEHWSYNGANDGWTYGEHFELLEREPMGKKEEFLKLMREAIEESKNAPEDKPPDQDDRYRMIVPEGDNPMADKPMADKPTPLQEAVVHLESSEAFVLVTMDSHPDPRAPKGILIPHVVRSSKSPVADLAVSVAIAKYAVQGYQELTEKVLGQLPGEQEL